MYIYKTTIIPTNEIYIGQCSKDSKDTSDYLGSGTILQHKINKYGVENCKKEILLNHIKDQEELNLFEIMFIKLNRIKYGRYKVLNIADGGSSVMLGRKQTEESKEKIRQAHLGKKQSPEAIAKRVAKNTGKKRTEESKQKMRKPRTEKGKANMKLAQNRLEVKEKKSKPCSEQTRLKMSIARKGVPKTEQHKKNISLSQIRQKLINRKCSEQTKQKI